MFESKVINKIMCIVLFILMISTSFTESYALTLKKLNPSLDKAIYNTGVYIYNHTPNPNVGTFSGEWSILCLSRGGITIPKSYYKKYYDNVVKTLKNCNGELHKIKYTEYSRVIIGLTSIGKDPRNVGGYNLLEKLADFNMVKKQGINGPIFALIALDTNNYKIPQVKGVEEQATREKLIDYILSKEIDGGGWALSGNNPDPDITAMALQSLAPYKDQEKVKSYIDRAINVLSKLQNKLGGYSSWGTTNSESVDQVIVALCALGINPSKDERFIKGNNWLLSNLMTFYVDGGGFKHVENMAIDAMATDQGMYGLIAYQRFLQGKSRLYDMTDVKESLNTGQNNDLNNNSNQQTSNNTENENLIQDNKINTNTNSSNGKSINDDENFTTNSVGSDSSTNSSPSKKSLSTNNKNLSKIDNSSSKDIKKEATIKIKIIYEGEENGLIPNDKKCIVVQFPKRNNKVAVKYNKKTNLYYSKELSNISKYPTYIGLVDKQEEKENLINIDNYKFMKGEGQEIIFGDLNNDKVVNAQDVLNLQSILNGKLDITNEQQIIVANVTMDSKIDNGDIDSIINKFVSNKDYDIFSIFKNKVKDKQSKKVSEES